MGRQKGTPETPSANGQKPERLPAYFLSLSVENVRCFGPKQTLDLSDGNGKPAPWTIILGLNGTGKTTLLQSLVGFELVRYNRPTGDPVWLPRFFTFSFDVQHSFCRGHWLNGGNWQGKLANCDNLGNVPLKVWDDLISISYTPSTQSMSGARAGSITGGLGNTQHSPWCCAYGAGRRVGSGALSTDESDDATATLFSDRAELRNAEEWLLQLDYAVKSHNKDAAHRLKQATELLLSIMPEDEITDVRFTTTGGVNPKARAEFKTPYGWVPLRQLGYGYQTLITWVADLVSRMAERYPDSKNPLAEPAVVLVDEIDLHLHPKWQRKLIGFLTERFPNTQFIATAHSPLVAQAAAEANLAVLRRDGDHVVIDNDVDNIRNWRVDQILTSDLFGLETARPPQVEALMMERKALLTKPKMTAADKRRVEELEEQIGPLPMGETSKEIEEREKMLRLLESLAKERKPAS